MLTFLHDALKSRHIGISFPPTFHLLLSFLDTSFLCLILLIYTLFNHSSFCLLGGQASMSHLCYIHHVFFLTTCLPSAVLMTRLYIEMLVWHLTTLDDVNLS